MQTGKHLTCIALLVVASAAADAAQSDQIGYQNCQQLLAKLLDCLLSASQSYLDNEQHLNDPLVVGRTLQRTTSSSSFEHDEEHEPSTRPMNWRPSKQSQLDDCWPKAIQWLRQQLLSAQMHFVLLDTRARLFACLRRFAQLSAYLNASVCTDQEQDQDQQLDSQELSLRYVRQACQVLADIYEQVQDKLEMERPERGSGKSQPRLVDEERGEQLAAEALKVHYSYLTQILSSYELLFGPSTGSQ